MLRAGWRILLFVPIFLCINLILTYAVRSIQGQLKGGGTLWFTLLGISATIAAYISRKYIDKENLVSLGLKLDKFAVLDVISGIVNSAIVMAGIYFTLLFYGFIEFTGFSWWNNQLDVDVQFTTAVIPVVLAVFWKFVVVAWWEELVFRGIILQNIIKGLGLAWAVVIGSVKFGLIHARNPDATILSTVLIIITTPQLIYAYLKTGQLWLPIGIHLGWNFFQASVFGFSSSGQASPSLILQKATGPDWLSGGAFGAEGSILMVPFVIGSLFLIHWWVARTRVPGQKYLDFLISKK